MQIKENSYSIVLVGKWNPAILAPNWIVANLFENNPSVQIEFSLTFDIPSRYKVGNITISPAVDRIIFLSNDNSDESLKLMESAAIKLCDILNHTPLVAVGINFGYIEKVNKEKLLPLMEFSDTDEITNDGWNISNQSITRYLSKNGYLTNLTISIDGNSDFNFDFNFQYQTLNANQVSEHLSGKVVDYKNQAISLLNTLYNIQIQENV